MFENLSRRTIMTAFDIFLYFCKDHMGFTAVALIGIIGSVVAGIALATLSIIRSVKSKANK